MGIILVYTLMMLSITMGYHRYYAHRMYESPVWLRYAFMVVGSLALVGKACAWVAQHRAHHIHEDTERDPHSPKHKGMLYCYFLQFLSPIDKRLLIFDKEVKWQHKWYWYIVASYIVLTLYFEVFLEAWLYPVLLVHCIGGLIYSYSHRSGKSHNDTWLGIITFGEGFHNTHHTSKQLRWHKYDIGGLLIEKI